MVESPVALWVSQEYSGMPLGRYLRQMGVSLTVVRGLKQQPDGMTVNGLKVHTDRRLAAGDIVGLNLPPADRFSAEPQAIPLDIVYASADALVVNKPPGMPIHPGPGIYSGTLANAVCGFYRSAGGGTFRPVGRLDADTSGLVLCARHVASAQKLANTSKKIYLALAEGQIPTRHGTIDAPLGAQTGSAVRQQVRGDGKQSLTHYEVLASGSRASLVRVRILTGRTHQIRAHFAHIGHPLLGDKLYGGDIHLIKRQALHCAGLAFVELQRANRPRQSCAPPRDMAYAAAACGLEKAMMWVIDRLFEG